MNRFFAFALITAAIGVAAPAKAETVFVVGGQTSVFLDPAVLTQAGLTLSGTSGPVISPGDLGSDSVAFPINSRGAAVPTTFAYNPNDFLGSFSGTIEHSGSLIFNEGEADEFLIGDFSIGFDGARAAGDASGFFVESTNGLPVVLFDIASPDVLEPLADSLTIEADLLISPELSAALGDDEGDFIGVTAGRALVAATAVPEPSAIAALGLGCIGLAARRRRALKRKASAAV